MLIKIITILSITLILISCGKININNIDSEKNVNSYEYIIDDTTFQQYDLQSIRHIYVNECSKSMYCFKYTDSSNIQIIKIGYTCNNELIIIDVKFENCTIFKSTNNNYCKIYKNKVCIFLNNIEFQRFNLN